MATRKLGRAVGGAAARVGGARKRMAGGSDRVGNAKLGNPSLRRAKGNTSKPGLRQVKVGGLAGSLGKPGRRKAKGAGKGLGGTAYAAAGRRAKATKRVRPKRKAY